MCGLNHTQPLVDLGFESSIFVLVFTAMLTAHLAGAATWVLLNRLQRRLDA